MGESVATPNWSVEAYNDDHPSPVFFWDATHKWTICPRSIHFYRSNGWIEPRWMDVNTQNPSEIPMEPL